MAGHGTRRAPGSRALSPRSDPLAPAPASDRAPSWRSTASSRPLAFVASVAAIAILLAAAACSSGSSRGIDGVLPIVGGVEAQPLRVHVGRIVQALEVVGAPLPADTAHQLDVVLSGPDHELAVGVQHVLDALCLCGVELRSDSVIARAGPAARSLVEHGWRSFLVKVHNVARGTGPLAVTSEQAAPLAGARADQVAPRWLALDPLDRSPLEPLLSGTLLEYRVLSLYSRDAGTRAATLSFAGSGDAAAPRGALDLSFSCARSIEVVLEVRDERGNPTVAGLRVYDGSARVHPATGKRLAPDLAFHHQVYREHGETITLPAGRFSIVATRGPEYLFGVQSIEVDAAAPRATIELVRWIDPAQLGWWSGDHHIHAAGCSHYSEPTAGIAPADLVRQCRGEDLKIGCALTWAPCFPHQSRYFTGAVDAASVHPHLLRYDIEVSGFGSHRAGHLCLLRLRDQVPPGADEIDGWPTLCLNTLRWAQAQGAVCGFAHSGLGLEVDSDELPNHVVPRFDGIGANEFIVDVTHVVPGPLGAPVPAVDFLGVCNTHVLRELNIWYHTLNCGYRARIAGETDFPCISSDRVGAGRSYVGLLGELDFDAWCDGLRAGRSYVSDGFSHLIDFTAGGVAVGSGDGELQLAAPAQVEVRASVAAWLDPTFFPQIDRSFDAVPFWHVEKARLGESRSVAVELVVNGVAVQSAVVIADGTLQDVRFDVDVTASSWLALRILGSSHTNPVFAIVGGAPIRASRRSAEWCRECVDACWSAKRRFVAAAELADAIAAYEHARAEYERIAAESPPD